MEVMQRLINVPEKRTGLAVTTEEAAMAACRQEAFDLVLLCAGIDEAAADGIRQQLAQINPAAIVIRHYGGGSGLLENEITMAMTVRRD